MGIAKFFAFKSSFILFVLCFYNVGETRRSDPSASQCHINTLDEKKVADPQLPPSRSRHFPDLGVRHQRGGHLGFGNILQPRQDLGAGTESPLWSPSHQWREARFRISSKAKQRQRSCGETKTTPIPRSQFEFKPGKG